MVQVQIKKAKKTKKQRKHGRNKKAQNLRYVASHQRERNKLRRLNKHLRRFVGDGCAKNAVIRCKAILGAQ